MSTRSRSLPAAAGLCLLGAALGSCATPTDGGGGADAVPGAGPAPVAADAPVPAPPSGVGPIAAGDGVPSMLPVAVDLVSVLVQLEGRSPYATTVQLNEPGPGFGAELVRALERAGYGLQFVSEDQGRNYLAYSAATRRTEIGRRAEFEIRLGGLSVARRMTVADGAWVPISPVTVGGVRPQPVALNGSVYVVRPDRALTYPSGVRFVDGDRTLASALHRYSYRPTGAAKEAGPGPAPDPLRFVESAAARLYDAGERAFSLRPASDFVPFRAVRMRFPTASSAMLGADNRRALEALTGLVDPAVDRLSVVSCSPDGRRTEDSAARSARVKAELLTLEVPGDQVLELGCPGAGAVSADGRNVVVTIERLRS